MYLQALVMFVICHQNGSVDPENNFAFEWEVSSTSKKHMKNL